jgi:hypothetical protein
MLLYLNSNKLLWHSEDVEMTWHIDPCTLGQGCPPRGLKIICIDIVDSGDLCRHQEFDSLWKRLTRVYTILLAEGMIGLGLGLITSELVYRCAALV